MTTPDFFSAKLKAREIVKSLGIDDASDLVLEDIAMIRGALVKEGNLKGAEGRLSSYGTNGLITVKSNIPELGRKRFIIAHELGHFELHIKESTTFSCSDTDFNQWLKTKPLEVEANYFAAELLMPEDLFKVKVSSSDLNIDFLQELMEEFQTSLTATSIRFVHFRPEFVLVFSENNRVKWFAINKEEFPYYLNLQGTLHQESLAYDFFHGKDLPRKFVEVSPEAWVDDYRFKGRAIVKELSIGIKSYNQVLSFIYIDTSDEDEDDDYYKELDGYPKFR